MSTHNETFVRLLTGAIASIAACEGTAAPAVEEGLGAQLGMAGRALRRYKAGGPPPDQHVVEVIAAAAVRRAFLGRAWLQVFLQAARYPGPEALIARLVGGAPILAPLSGALPSGTVTFLFTDIVGSTRIWEQQAGAMQRALARHDALLRQAITTHGGHIFKTVGDAFCAAFTTAPAAVGAALSIQRLVLFEPWSASGLDAPIQVRTVLHTGAAEERDGDYFGPPLNRVARLCAVGHGGQVLLSLAAQDLARDRLPVGVGLRDLGEQRMKDLARPERIFQLLAPDLPADFPALRTLNAYRHNLPAQPTALIGRERQVEELTELLRTPDLRLLTLSGPGGTGKTRLALQAAGELVEQFADGVWLVGLAPISDPNLVVGTIADVFGLRAQPNRPIAELLHDYVREKALLLVLDNFEQVLPAAGQIADLLAAAPRLTVLVTSRVVLRLYGEHEYGVPPLSLPERVPPPTIERMTQYEAVRLFIERARAARADFAVTAANAPQIAEICHRLDGLPLAIELAAARSKLFAPQAILARLDRRLVMLTGGAQNQAARQQTLRGAIDWSYNLLDAGEQESFARLGVFAGGCTVDSAEAVLTAGGDMLLEPLDMLASLVDKSLLRHVEGFAGEPRFVMLETLREYALERLAASDSAEITRRAHAECFVALAEAGESGLHGAEELLWLERLSAEHDNLRAALGWCAGPGDQHVMAARLVGALADLWNRRGHWREGLDWAERLRHTAGQPGRQPEPDGGADALPALLRARVLAAQGKLGVSLSDFAPAKLLLERSLVLFEEAGDRSGSIDALIELGRVALGQSDYTAMLTLLRPALERAKLLGDPYRHMEAADSLGFAFYVRDDLAAARSIIEEALDAGQSLGPVAPRAGLLQNLGLVLLYTDEPTQAANAQEAALAIFKRLGDRHNASAALIRLGQTILAQGDPQRAHGLFTEGLGIRRELGDRRGCVGALGNLPLVCLLVGERQQARAYAVELLGLAVELGYQQGQVWGLGSMADTLVEEHPEAALHLLAAAERLREAAGIPVWPDERAYHERVFHLAHAALSDDAYAAAWAAGRALGVDEAMAEALAFVRM